MCRTVSCGNSLGNVALVGGRGRGMGLYLMIFESVIGEIGGRRVWSDLEGHLSVQDCELWCEKEECGRGWW